MQGACVTFGAVLVLNMCRSDEYIAQTRLHVKCSLLLRMPNVRAHFTAFWCGKILRQTQTSIVCSGSFLTSHSVVTTDTNRLGRKLQVVLGWNARAIQWLNFGTCAVAAIGHILKTEEAGSSETLVRSTCVTPQKTAISVSNVVRTSNLICVWIFSCHLVAQFSTGYKLSRHVP
jgi:hypothetical protein